MGAIGLRSFDVPIGETIESRIDRSDSKMQSSAMAIRKQFEEEVPIPEEENLSENSDTARNPINGSIQATSSAAVGNKNLSMPSLANQRNNNNSTPSLFDRMSLPSRIASALDRTNGEDISLELLTN